MNRRLLLVALCLVAQSVNAQHANKDNNDALFNTLFSSKANYNFLLPALDSSICILRQEYTLVDAKGNEYGANNKTYWGWKYGLGVITDSGIYALKEVLAPWKGDTDLENYIKSDTGKLQHQLSTRLFKRPSDKKFKSINPDTTKAAYSVLTDASIIVIPFDNTLPAISSTRMATDTSGFILLVTGAENQEIADSAKFNYVVVKPIAPAISAQKETTRIRIKNTFDKTNVIGGIYYTVNISLGKCSFIASGVLDHDDKGWCIVPLAAKATHNSPDRTMINSGKATGK